MDRDAKICFRENAEQSVFYIKSINRPCQRYDNSSLTQCGKYGTTGHRISEIEITRSGTL